MAIIHRKGTLKYNSVKRKLERHFAANPDLKAVFHIFRIEDGWQGQVLRRNLKMISTTIVYKHRKTIMSYRLEFHKDLEYVVTESPC